MILFAVVIGAIEALQYFTQAYVGGDDRGGSASSAGDPSNHLGYPEGSTLFYPVLLYQQGFRFFNMGYASAMAILLLVVVVRGHAGHRPQLAPLGALRGRRALMSRERRRRRSRRRRAARAPRGRRAPSRRRRLLIASPTTAC